MQKLHLDATTRSSEIGCIASGVELEVGELYLFHVSDPRCPASASMWGVFSREQDGDILLESSSSDLESFKLWHKLPSDYKYVRLAQRSELRDYIYNLSLAEQK